MKILMLTTSYPRFMGDYSGRFVHELAKNISVKKESVEVLVPPDPKYNTPAILDNISIHRFSYFFPKKLQMLTSDAGRFSNLTKNLLSVLQIPLFMLSFMLKLVKLAPKFDVIHCHWIFTGLIAVSTKFIHKRPIIVTIRSPQFIRSKKTRFITGFVLNRVDAVALISNEFVDDVLKFGVSKEKINVIYNGVYTEVFKPLDRKITRKKLNLPQDKLVILSVGSFIERKGIIYLLDALSRLEKKDFVVVLIGDGPQRKFLERYVGDNNLNSKVYFPGFVNDRQIPYYMASADIYVSPSLAETGPNTVLEALSSGVPTIATRVGLCPEVVEDDANGYLVPVKDSNAIENKITVLIENPQLREKMALGARGKIIEKKISWKKCAEQYISLYRKVLS